MQPPSQPDLLASLLIFLEKNTHVSYEKINILKEKIAQPGIKVLDGVLSAFLENRDKTTILNFLIDQGANPLDPAQASLKKYVMPGSFDMLCSVLKHYETENHLLRSPDGGNFLHFFYSTDPGWLKEDSVRKWFSDEIVSNADEVDINRKRLPPPWFNEPRTCDGKTPLHVWWDTVENRLSLSNPPLTDQFFAFDVSEALIRNGALVETLDHQGVSCARRMIETAKRFNMELPGNAPGVQRAVAVVDIEYLEERTSPAQALKRARRL